MHLHLNEAQIDRAVASRRAKMLIGVGLMSLPFVLPKGWGFGGLTGFMIFSLGVYASVLSRWRTEPGLWMLAVFLTVVQGGSWGYFECLSLQSLFAAPDPLQSARKWSWEQDRFAIDSAAALAVFGQVARFVASVSVANWRLTRSVSTPPFSLAQPDEGPP